MQDDGKKLQIRECFGEHPGTAVANWAKRWNHWGGRGSFDCLCIDEERTSRSCGVVRRWIMNAGWSCYSYGCVSRPMVSTIDLIWITSFCHRCLTACSSFIFTNYWAGHSDLEMQMRANRRLTYTCVTWHNGKLFALSPRNPPKMSVLVSHEFIGWEPSLILLVPSPSVFL